MTKLHVTLYYDDSDKPENILSDRQVEELSFADSKEEIERLITPDVSRDDALFIYICQDHVLRAFRLLKKRGVIFYLNLYTKDENGEYTYVYHVEDNGRLKEEYPEEFDLSWRLVCRLLER